MPAICDRGHPMTSNLYQRDHTVQELLSRHSRPPGRSINPRHVPAHFNLGNILANHGDWAGAEKEYARVLEIDPADADTKNCLRIVRENMRK